MKKKIISCFLTLVILVLLFPATVQSASVNNNTAVTACLRLKNNIPIILLSVNTFSDAPKSVSAAIVPSGTPIENVSSDGALTMTAKGSNNSTWEYAFNEADMTLITGDFNLWFFLDDNKIPLSDNNCWRYDKDKQYFNSFRGLDSKRSYVQITKSSLSDFTLTAYSVIADKTYFELIKRESGQVAWRVGITQTGSAVYALPEGLTGGYILRYTRDDRVQNVAYLRIKKGTLPFGISSVNTGTAELINFKGNINDLGKVTGFVNVDREDFNYFVELYVVDINTKIETSISPKLENGAISSNGMLYNFDFKLEKIPSDGMYLLRIKRGDKIKDIWKFEIFKEKAHGMLPGETPISPLSVDDLAMRDEYYRIFILEEFFDSPASAVKYFSLDGGKKWQAVSNISKYKEKDSVTAQTAYSKLFDKGFELWFSDTAPINNKMPDNAKLIKFPTVGKRPAAPKLEVNYQLAHINNGVLDFDFYDDNLWVAVEKGKTTPISEGYICRYGGVKENNNGILVQTGKPDFHTEFFMPDPSGMPIPVSDEDNGGIMYSETSDRVTYKTIKENYFFSTIPYMSSGIYYPTSKPANLKVSSYIKPKAMKIDYRKEALKLIAGAVFEDKSLYDGIVSVETAKSKTNSILNITELLNDEQLIGSYRIAPTAKTPASCMVFWEFAYRGNDVFELESEAEGDKEVNITQNGKFTPSKALEFRQKVNGVWSKWGNFIAPKTSGIEYEYRAKPTAKGGKLIFDSEWFIIDSLILTKEDEAEVWAAGIPEPFEYGWGKDYQTINGKDAVKDGVEWTNLG